MGQQVVIWVYILADIVRKHKLVISNKARQNNI